MNKELTAKYDRLVERASELIKVLPWGADFEVDVRFWLYFDTFWIYADEIVTSNSVNQISLR